MFNFFKELQDRYLLLFCFFVLMIFYFYLRTDAVLQLMINFGVAIIALSTKTQKPTQTINADSVENANSLITDKDSMPDAK